MEPHLTPRDRHLRAAEELAGIGSWYWNLRTQQGTWSNGMFKLFGLQPAATAPSLDELAGLVTPHSFSRARNTLELLVARGTPADVEIEVIRPNGEHHWLPL